MMPGHGGTLAGMARQEFTDFDVAHWPRWRKQETVVGMDGWAISPQSKNKQAAWEFLRFYLSHEGQRARVELSQRPASTVLRSLAMESPMALRLYEALDHARTVPSPVQIADANAEVTAWVKRLLDNEISPREASEQLHRQLTGILGRQ